MKQNYGLWVHYSFYFNILDYRSLGVTGTSKSGEGGLLIMSYPSLRPKSPRKNPSVISGVCTQVLIVF